VYWRGGQQAARGAALYASGARHSFTYPPDCRRGLQRRRQYARSWLAAVITAGSVGALAVFCALVPGAAGVQRRFETVFATSALAVLT